MDPLHSGAPSGVRHHLRVLRRRRGVLVLGVLATLVPAVVFSLLKDPVYQAEAEMLVRSSPIDETIGATAGIDNPERTAENVIRVLQGRAVNQRVADRFGLDGEAPAVSGVPDGNADVIKVRIETGDADHAAALADAYVEAYIAHQREAAVARIDEASEQLRLQIAELGERIDEVDADLANRAATREAEISELRSQVRDLESQRTVAQIRLGELDGQTDLSITEVAERRELAATVGDLDGQIADLEARISDVNLEDDSTLERSRQTLFDQESEFIQRLDELQVESALTTGGAELLTPAEVPAAPASPKPINAAVLAIIAGLLLGAIAAFVLEYLDDSILGPADLAKLGDAPAMLAAVPDETPPDARPISLSTPDSFVVEAYRTLRTNVQFLGIERDMQVIQVTSAVPGEGKSTTAANLAAVLSQTGRTVVLVDADLRKPTVHRAFGVARTYGLTTNLAGEILDLTLQRTTDGPDVLVAGPIPPNPSELLSSHQMGALVNELRARYDYVVVDAAPVLAVSDALALAQFVDGVLVVVQSNHTSVPRVRNALEALDQVSAPVVGLVLNRIDPRKADLEAYQYGSTYGEVYGAEKTQPPQRVPR
ncbi:MAG: polysaccharide biosynthesis tyrosine autokinase [Ilumatobacteraceae bacterium]